MTKRSSRKLQVTEAFFREHQKADGSLILPQDVTDEWVERIVVAAKDYWADDDDDGKKHLQIYGIIIGLYFQYMAYLKNISTNAITATEEELLAGIDDLFVAFCCVKVGRAIGIKGIGDFTVDAFMEPFPEDSVHKMLAEFVYATPEHLKDMHAQIAAILAEAEAAEEQE